MGKNKFGKTMLRALSQNLKISGEQIMSARSATNNQGFALSLTFKILSKNSLVP